MVVDLTKFPFNGLSHSHARTLTEAIAEEPVADGFIVVTLKGGNSSSLVQPIRALAQLLRSSAEEYGFRDITACRQLRRDELGGAVPFDQAFCESVLDDAAARSGTQSERFPGLVSTQQFVLGNSIADWVLMITFGTPDQAQATAEAWRGENSLLSAVFSGHVDQVGVNAFQNMMRYAHVSLDPNVIQFFNLFPGPGDPDALWTAWAEVLPRYFDAAEIRSSFPLKALDPQQPLILVNFAHADSVKHFMLSMIFDPNFLDDIERCYERRGFAFPHPFFCKVIPV